MGELSSGTLILLCCVAALAGIANGLRHASKYGKARAVMVGMAEAMTAMLTTLCVFAILYSVLPLAGIKMPEIGLLGIAGLAGHLGIRESINLARMIIDKKA